MMFDLDILARAIHVLAVVIWIGGVAFMTMVILPALRTFDADRRIVLLETVEKRFATIARLAILFAGASGLYMVWSLDLWDRFRQPPYWWMDAMVAIWILFAAILFILEPFVLRRRFLERARANPEATLASMQKFHWLLLAASLITIAAATAGVHGFSFG